MKGHGEQSVGAAANGTGAVKARAVLSKRLWMFAVVSGLLCLSFIVPLVRLAQLAVSTALHSHIPLIPIISAYLIWLRRRALPPNPTSSPALGAIPLAIGLVALHAYFAPGSGGVANFTTDKIAAGILAFVCLLWASALFLLGAPFLRPIAFPVAFLVFMVPLPTFLQSAAEVLLQRGSAEAAALFFWMTGSAVFRDGLVFQLPGITIQVAEECSGIRSTYVLFITSLLAGYACLRSYWSRAVLALAVIPLGLIRNGLRVYTIGWLCVHVSPTMIDSVVHRRGGPIFFALSLVPLFLLLIWLYKAERRNSRGQSGS